MSNFRKYLLFSFIFALINAVVLLVFFVSRFDHTDTPQYVSTIKYILGDPAGEVFLHRILNPMPILISAALSPILTPANALIAQNLVFYFLSVWLIYLLIFHFYRNGKQAFYGTVLFGAAYPMLAYGLASLTDMAGWFFYLFSVFIALRLLEKPQLKTAFWAGITAGFGMLFKENVAAAPIFFVSFLLIATQLPPKEKLKYILAFGAAFLCLPIINSIVLYNLYSYFYLDAYLNGGLGAKSGFYMVSFTRILIEIGRVLLVGWLFVLLGVLKELAVKNIERIKILISFLPPSLSFLLWIYPHNRIIYIAFPLLVILGSLGLLRAYKNPKINAFIEMTLLSAYILLNYLVLEFLLKYGPLIQPYLKYNL